jgi:glycosyltransferase involved in cell wall biosynthesis
MNLNPRLKAAPVALVRPLKIALFEEACAGGSGRHVADLASSLAADGHDVHLLYSRAHIDARFREGLAALEQSGGTAFPIDICHEVHLSDLRAVLDVRAYLVQRGRFDVFHCHSTKAGLVGRLAALGLGIRTIYTPHAFFTMSPVDGQISSRGAQIIERTLSRTTDIFICVSDEESEHARSLGIAESKIRLIPNGIPVSEAQEWKSCRAIVRDELGLSPADICIGAVGRLVHQKATQVLIEAFALAAAQLGKNVKLIIVGAGPLRPKLEVLAKRRRLGERIQFAGELPGLRTMSAFDIFALSSCYEGHPYTFIEALSLGLPIVTTCVGGAKMSVVDGVNGFISPVGDAPAMANSLLKLASSVTLREQMSRASLRMAGDFTLDKMLRGTSKVYEGALKTRELLARSAGA